MRGRALLRARTVSAASGLTAQAALAATPATSKHHAPKAAPSATPPRWPVDPRAAAPRPSTTSGHLVARRESRVGRSRSPQIRSRGPAPARPRPLGYRTAPAAAFNPTVAGASLALPREPERPADPAVDRGKLGVAASRQLARVAKTVRLHTQRCRGSGAQDPQGPARILPVWPETRSSSRLISRARGAARYGRSRRSGGRQRVGPSELADLVEQSGPV